MNVAILGAGKVGRALFRALAQARVRVRLVPLRRQSRARFDEDLLIVAVRDPELPRVARELARGDRVAASTAVVHVAGGVDPEVLAPLRARSAGIGQAHPMLSFASPRWAPALAGGHLLLRGDRVAVQRGRQLARALGMVARRWEPLDAALYHAAGGLVANGAAALCAAGARLLELAGAPASDTPKVLGPLLASVANNVGRLGFPESLTGPIRRGDARAVSAHLERIRARAPELLPLYGALAELQLQLASQIGEAPAKRLNEVRRTVRASGRRASLRPRRS
jgi:predicted short-subunit dehydrogenase-like oxidoreductase (DUF2520 family)